MMKKAKKKVLGAAYSSYHGRVRIPFVTPKIPDSLGEGVYMNAGCAGHVVLDAPEASASEVAAPK